MQSSMIRPGVRELPDLSHYTRIKLHPKFPALKRFFQKLVDNGTPLLLEHHEALSLVGSDAEIAAATVLHRRDITIRTDLGIFEWDHDAQQLRFGKVNECGPTEWETVPLED